MSRKSIKILFGSVVLLLTGQLTVAQQPAKSPPAATTSIPARPTIPAPVYLLNARFIVGGLWDVVPANIAELLIYKGADAPPRWRSLTAHGLVSVTLKKKPKLKAKSLADISRWMGLTGPVSFQLEGLPLEDATLRVVTEAIAGIDVVRPTAGNSPTVVTIRLVRTNPRPTYHPPGTIMIRGEEGQ